MKCQKKQSNTMLATGSLPTQSTIRKPIELVFTPAALRRVMREAVEKRTTKVKA